MQFCGGENNHPVFLMEINEIKERLTLAMVLHYYGLKPDKNMRLRCPFHEDKTPSFQVYYKTHTCYCFSSRCPTHGKSMDVIDFILHKESCTKAEAIQKAAALAGNSITSTTATSTETPALVKPSISREQFLQNMFTYFKNALYNSKPARDYLKLRSLDPLRLEVGYNTAQFHHGTRKDNDLINNCVVVGLLLPWGSKGEEPTYKPFGKYSVVFALRNKTDQITGLYFRSTETSTEAKHYYLKDSTGLYPSYPNPQTKKLIIPESIIDTASLLQIKEITETYSLLSAYGTNRLNEEMKSAIVELKELEEIIFAFDNDEAGHKAASKYKEELQALLPEVKFTKLQLPCKDVNETLTAHNEEVFTQLLGERTDNFLAPLHPPNGGTLTAGELNTSNPYKLSYTSDTAVYYVQGGLPKTNEHLRIMLVVENKSNQQKSRNKIDLYEDKQVEKLCRETAEKLQLRKDLLEADLYKLTDLLESHIEKSLHQNSSEEKPLQVLTIKEKAALEDFAKGPKLIKRLNELLSQTGIVGEDRNRIFLLIIAISHKMPETLHALIQGSSGSGKTRLLKQISDCIPKESVTKLTRLSDKVLYNFPENYFINRLLCLEDIDGLSEDAEFAFRELQSNGELNSATSIKLDNGQITSGQKTVRGPIASLACTTKGEIYEDNMSRVFLIAVDESSEQTKRIIAYQNSVAAGVINREDEEKTKLFLQQFVSILQPYKVVNPFASKIQLPEEAHKIRRLNDLFQSFVKMVTILNQYQRKQDNKKRLITEIDDVETAVAVMFESIVLKVDELDGSLRHFYEQLKQYLQKQHNGKHQTAEFGLREVRHTLKASKMQVFRYFNDLQQLEYVRQVGGHANRGFTYKVVYWDDYSALRERIKKGLYEQLDKLKQVPSVGGDLGEAEGAVLHP